MLIIRTLNSEYSIKAEGDRFRITKIANLPHGGGENRVLASGEFSYARSIDVEVGRSATFMSYDGSPDWHTSKVLEVREATASSEPPHGYIANRGW